MKCYLPRWLGFLLVLPAWGQDVIINEIMYHPASQNVREEYLELFNRGTNAVSLQGWRFTKGIDYAFSNNVTLAAGAYWVVAADLGSFTNKYPGVTNVVGGWTGVLSNSREEIEFQDAQGLPRDSVSYADEGDWAVRQRGPLDNGHRGWEWFAEADGLGKSMELANAALPNDSGQNWAPSIPVNGTPGAPNSVASSDTAPLILDTAHSPDIPKSTEAVAVTARIVDEQTNGRVVHLFYSDASAGAPPAFTNVVMFDDGQHGEGLAGDGVFGAILLPAQPDRTVIEFYVQASDAAGHARTWPAAARQEDGTFAQTANALYQVDDSVYGGPQPIYRLVLTEPERNELASGTIRDSNAEMNGSLITLDGTGAKLRYNVGIRIRGAGSRGAAIPNYRVNVPTDRLWNGVNELNLNAQYGHSQLVGSAVSLRAGLPAAEARAIQVRVNGMNLANSGLPQYGSYALLEVVNGDWAEKHFPFDANGNVYAARRPNTDLRYLGTNYINYLGAGYSKTANISENDWSDLVRLTDVLNNSSNETYAQAVRQVANVQLWARYFAIFTLLGSGETSLGTGVGDDYNMYRGIADPRFLLLPHDLDTVLAQGQGPAPVDADLFRAAGVAAVGRFLRHSEFAPLYFAELKRIAERVLSPGQLDPLIDELLQDYVPAATLSSMKAYAVGRVAFVLSHIPLDLAVNSSLPLVNGFRQTTSPTITLSGQANAIETRTVQVGGQSAAWTAWQGSWTASGVPVHPGINRVLVQAFDASGTEIGRATLDVWYDDSSVAGVGGTLMGDATWSASGGPYLLTNNLTVPAQTRLTIQPGTTIYAGQGFGLTVNGALLAEGSDLQRIRFTRVPGTSVLWAGLNFLNTTQSNRLSFVDVEFASSGQASVNLLNSTLYADNCTWSGTTSTVIEMNNSSLHLRCSVLPSIQQNETIHGNGMPANGFVVIEQNLFGTTTGYSDVIDFTGGRRPGPILQVYNNFFTGGGDDALDLDGTDAHIEGNVFMNFIQDGPRDSTANAIATDNAADIVAVRNLFFNNDHAALLKVGSFLTAHHNTIVGSHIAAFNFDEPERPGVTPGRGALLDGNILWNNASNFQHLYVNDPIKGTIDLTVSRSIIPGTNLWPGFGNLNADPRLFNTDPNTLTVFTLTNDFRLRPGSPAIGAGPSGLDMGALVRAGAAISGEPSSPTYRTSAALQVAGPGITHYRYRLNNGSFSAETAVTNAILLAGLSNGTYVVSVIGKNSAGVWQPENSPTTSRPWTVNASYASLRLNEVLARNVNAVSVGGEYPDLIELFNDSAAPMDLGGMGLTDDPADKFKFKIPPGTTVGPGQYLLLHADAESEPGLHTGFGLDGNGDGLFLYSPAGSLLDSVQFGPQVVDFSIGRVGAGAWTLTRPTFGTVNLAQPLGTAVNLNINEWLAAGQTLFPDDFVELYNPEPVPVALGGLYLTDEPLGAPGRHRIAELSFIGPGGFVAFVADGDAAAGPNHLNFKLAPEQGVLGLAGQDLSLIDWVIYGPQTLDISEGRRPNGASTIAFFGPPTQTVPTPGASNPGEGAMVTVTNIVLGLLPLTAVWQYEASGVDLGSDWRAPEYDDSLWLAGPALLHNESSTIVPERNTFLPLTSPPQITFYFRTRFLVETNLEGFTLTGVAFLDDGALVYLNGTEVARLRMPLGPVAYSDSATASPPGGDATAPDVFTLPLAALVPGTNFLAVEVHQAVPSSDIAWGLALFAVRAVTNITGVSVLLNEVLADNRGAPGPDGVTADYVELHNPSGELVDLSDMSLSDDLGNSRRWVIPAGTTLPPGGYQVIRFDDSAPASTALAPILNTGFGLGANGDRVLLLDKLSRGGGLLDAVAFGLQTADFSIGRIPNGTGAWNLTLPTAGALNLPASLGSPSELKVNEWMADPRSGDDWLELFNPGRQPVALGGLHLTDNLNNRTKHRIAPLSFIGSSTNGFVQFFADENPQNGADHVRFRLSAGGESIGIATESGALMDSIVFGAQQTGVSEGRLPDGATGLVRFPVTPTPAESNFLPLNDVVINEALTHSDAPLEDAIEVHNQSSEAVAIGGWYLSDSNDELRKFRVPAGTVIAAGGFVVFYEYQFNPEPGLFPSFALSSADGDQIYLTATDPAGALTGYRAFVRFGAAESGVSFGRHETSVGADFTAMSAGSFGVDTPASTNEFRQGTGRLNPYPKVGPIVVSEVMYHPPDIDGTNDNTGGEFVELHNLSPNAVPLFDMARATNTWQLRDAVRFDFPAATSLPPGGFLLVVSFDPTTDLAALNAFRATYQVSPTIPILGPFVGKLENSSDSVELYKPDEPQPDGEVPFVLVDKVRYTDSAPWPTGADTGTNNVSLQRRVAADYGNDPVNWLAGSPTPGAGTGPAVAVLPAITTPPGGQLVAPGVTVTFAVAANGAAPLGYQWRFNGQDLAGATNTSLILNNVQAVQAGKYSVRVSNRAGAALSSTALLTLQLPPLITQQPQVQVVAPGTTAQFGVAARGTPPLSYQWRFSGANLAGATNHTLTLTNVQFPNQGSYLVFIANPYGAVTSSLATLTIHQPPAITDPPDSQTLFAGATATLNVSATGTPPLGYQWRYNGINISGATSSTLVLSNAQPGQSGSYTVRVTNLVGSVFSQAALLTIVVPPMVTVAAGDPVAAEPGGDTGEFAISRTGAIALPLTVNVALTGTAGNGTDYGLIVSPVTIPAGAAATTVRVTPLDDAHREAVESVVLTVRTGAQYVVGIQASATVFLFDDENVPPSIAINSPTNGARYAITPTNVQITVSASDADGSVSKVEYFNQGSTRLGQSTSPPFSFVWSNAVPGTNALTAVATDDLGATNVSAARLVMVNFPPSVSILNPGQGAVFGPGTDIPITAQASDSDGTVLRMDFYAGATLIATDLTAPFSATLSGPAVGVYALTARAIDDQGMPGTSSVVSVTVKAPSSNFADFFFDRGDISGVTNFVAGNNTLATREPGEPPPYSSGANTMWLTWTAPASGACVMDTFGSSFDTVLSVYTNSPANIQTVSNLALVAENDDFDGVQSRVTFAAVAGQAYHVRVDSFSSFGPGPFLFHLFLSTPLPIILAQPQDRTVVPGSPASFNVSAAGTPPLRYQWRFNGLNLPAGTSATLSIPSAQSSHLGEYMVVVNNSLSSVTSRVATLAFGTPAVIVQPPQSQTALVGDDVTFSVAVTGTLPMGYFWRLSTGVPVASMVLNEHTSSFTLTNVQLNQSGLRYRVVATNAVSLNGAASGFATLTVLVDTDGDRMPDVWESLFGLNPQDPADAAPDGDSDTLSNLQEYIAGTNPTNALSYLKVDAISPGVSGALLRFTAASNRTYTVLYSDSSPSGPWLSLTNVGARTTNRVETVTDPAPAAPGRFYRLVAPRQP